MIFVTVGTHEQPFNRLIEEIDKIKTDGVIRDSVFIQRGYTTYIPKSCEYTDFCTYSQMHDLMSKADIVITHGGPASFLQVLQHGKIPIVVPRQSQFNEHINNHQVDFVKQVSSRMHNILPVFDIHDLSQVILNYNTLVKSLQTQTVSNNTQFCLEFADQVNQLFKR